MDIQVVKTIERIANSLERLAKAAERIARIVDPEGEKVAIGPATVTRREVAIGGVNPPNGGPSIGTIETLEDGSRRVFGPDGWIGLAPPPPQE